MPLQTKGVFRRVEVWRIRSLVVAAAFYGIVSLLILRKGDIFHSSWWCTNGDCYGLLGLLCALPLCALAIRHPLAGSALLCFTSILSACGYILLPSMIGPIAWGVLNAPAFGIGLIIFVFWQIEFAYSKKTVTPNGESDAEQTHREPKN